MGNTYKRLPTRRMFTSSLRMQLWDFALELTWC